MLYTKSIYYTCTTADTILGHILSMRAEGLITQAIEHKRAMRVNIAKLSPKTLARSCWSLGSESIGAEAVVDVRKIWLSYQDKRDA